MVGWYHRLNGHEFEQLGEILKDREAWCAAAHRVAKSQTQLCDQTTRVQPLRILSVWPTQTERMVSLFYKYTSIVLHPKSKNYLCLFKSNTFLVLSPHLFSQEFLVTSPVFIYKLLQFYVSWGPSSSMSFLSIHVTIDFSARPLRLEEIYPFVPLFISGL